jgi:hypothetical protein
MGAALGAPGKTVIDIDGDGSYLMTCYELATIAEYNIPVKGRDPQQRLPGHDQAVAGPVLREALQQQPDEEPQLRRDGRRRSA